MVITNSPRSSLTVDLAGLLAQNLDLWEGLRRAHLFLTSGTGFFGCWLLESLTFAHDCAQQELGLGPSNGLTSAISRTLSWYARS